MTPVETAILQREFRIFTRYLTGGPLNSYVLEKYVDAHEKVSRYQVRHPFDRLLLRLSVIHPMATKLADAYARAFAPSCALRKKLVLLLAVLETSPSGHSFLDLHESRTRTAVTLEAVRRSVSFLLGFLLATILLSPIHLVLRGVKEDLRGNR
jgi:hypothetical protein